MPDPLEDYLRRSPLTPSQRASVWDAYEAAKDEDELAASLTSLNVPKQVKAGLWDMKAAASPVVEPAGSAEEAFPTPMQTAGTMVGGAGRALKGMALGALETGANLAGLGAVRDTWARANNEVAPSDAEREASIAHLRAAVAPGPAGAGERIGEAVTSLPTVGPAVMGAVRQAGAIAMPAYKTVTLGVGSVTPSEMEQAAEAGGGAVAGLAVGGAPRVGQLGKWIGGKLPAVSMGKLLKFAEKSAEMGGKAALYSHFPLAAVAEIPSAIRATKELVSHFAKPEVISKAGTITQDAFIAAAESGDLAAAAKIISKAEAKNPALAEAHAAAVEQAVKAPVPKDTYAGSPEALAFEADRAARLDAALARRMAAEAETVPVKAKSMPVKGNVRMPSVSKGTGVKKPIAGKPLTVSEREAKLKALQQKVASQEDIWAAFGVGK